MLRDVKRLLGSLYEEYDYEVDAAWVGAELQMLGWRQLGRCLCSCRCRQLQEREMKWKFAR